MMTNQREPLQPRLVSKPFFTRLTATLLLLPAISVASDVLLPGLALISAALAEEVEQAVPEPGDEVRLVHVKDVVMGDSHYWNTVVHSGYNKLMTHGDYQYAVYWNSEFRLTLGRRHLQTDEVATTVFPYTGYPHDVHNVPVLGFSPQDGRLHLAWHMRGAPGLPASNYVVSDSKLISDPPDTMTTDDFRPRVEFVEGAFVTYPRFFNDPDGRLFQIFRNGGAASYSSHFLAYNGDIAIDRDQNLFVTFPRPTSEVFVVQSHLSTPTKRVEYPITGPLFDDLRPVSRERFAFFRWEGKVDRPRWERDQIFSLPAVVRKDGAFHFVIKDYVLQKPAPAP
jgi:hypothetical protein